MLNQRGMASIEMIPILLLFVLLMNFGLGFFGVIHSGILSSIAARNYAFETFRNRANLNYLRDEASNDVIPYYSQNQMRFHSIVTENQTAAVNTWVAKVRPIQFTETNPDVGVDPVGSVTDHNVTIRSMASDSVATSTYFRDRHARQAMWVWIRYGSW